MAGLAHTGVNHVKVTLEPNDHPYRNGAWTPLFEELDRDDLEVVGDIPTEVHNARPWQRGFSIAVVEYAREAAVVSKAW